MPRTGTPGAAFANALTNNKDGFTTLLAVVTPNLPAKPDTILYNKVTIKGAKQAVQMFGPAQAAVARAVVTRYPVASSRGTRSKTTALRRRLHPLGRQGRQENLRLQLPGDQGIHRAGPQASANGGHVIQGAKTAHHPFAGGADKSSRGQWQRRSPRAKGKPRGGFGRALRARESSRAEVESRGLRRSAGSSTFYFPKVQFLGLLSARAPSMKKLLLQLDSSRHASVFDQVVAYDAGVDEIMSTSGVTRPMSATWYMAASSHAAQRT